MLLLWQRATALFYVGNAKPQWLKPLDWRVAASIIFGISALERSAREHVLTPQRIGKHHRDVLHAKRHEKRKDGAWLVKQRLPSVSTGRPQLLQTNIRHAVAAYGLMVTVQSELRRSAVRNAARKTARVISAALCAPPNDRTILLPPARPLNPSAAEWHAECLRNAQRKNTRRLLLDTCQM